MKPPPDCEIPAIVDALALAYRVSYRYARHRWRDGLAARSIRPHAAAISDDLPLPLELAEVMWCGIEDALAYRPPRG